MSQNSKNTQVKPAQSQFWKTEKDAELSAKYQIYNTLIKSAVYTYQSEGKLMKWKPTVNLAYVFVFILPSKTVT
jgi:peptidyl-prolyl cis-trans isomerase D